MMDLLANARKKIVTEWVSTVEQPPKDFSKPYNNARTVGSSLAGAGLGAWLGSHMGVALLGTAMGGAWIFGPLIGLAMYGAPMLMPRD